LIRIENSHPHDNHSRLSRYIKLVINILSKSDFAKPYRTVAIFSSWVTTLTTNNKNNNFGERQMRHAGGSVRGELSASENRAKNPQRSSGEAPPPLRQRPPGERNSMGPSASATTSSCARKTARGRRTPDPNNM